MTISRTYSNLSQTLIAVAVAAAFGPVQAQDAPDLAQLTAPGKSVSLGVGLSSGNEKDRARFGMFNGLRDGDSNALLGFSYNNREESTGKWMSLEGRNLGLDNRELGFSYRQLGDMKFTVDYSELVRHDPRTINTSMGGAGSTTPTVSLLATPGTGQNVNLELKRKGLTFAYEKQLGNNLQFEASFKNEEKDGSRLFGKGFACAQAWKDVGACTGTSAGAVLMLPEPVDSTTRQFDAKLNYTGEKLRLSGGYYGSFYTNRNGSLNPTIVGAFGDQNGGANAADAGLATVMGQPMALPPDNQSHQLSLGGNYTLTSHTRMNFKYVYTHATQNEAFALASGLASGRSNLGGEINTTKGQVGFSSGLTDKLHLHGDLAFNQKKNKTPLDLYNSTYACTAGFINGRSCVTTAGGAVLSPNTVARYTNGNQSPKKYDAKLEASYRLPQDYSLIAGVNYEYEDFGAFTSTDVAGGVTGMKQKLKDSGYQLELRKSMSETFTGSLGYTSNHRVGDSPWLQPANFNDKGVTGLTEVADTTIYSRTAIFPFIYMDRKREKVRFMGNWTPTDRLSLQLFVDNGSDTFSGPTEHGLRKTSMDNLSLDADYAISDVWKLNGYYSQGSQSTNAGHSTGYDAEVRDKSKSIGVGLKGKLSERFQVGGDLTWLNDRLIYGQTADSAATAANITLVNAGGLPDVTYGLMRLKLFGMYAVQKNAFVRMDLVHSRTTFNEWTYNYSGTPYLYSDNTTINANQKQSVTFLGASYVYKFQ